MNKEEGRKGRGGVPLTSPFPLKETLCKVAVVLNREQLYLEGGVLFVTSRILVVDFLKKHCPLEKVAGILVFNAHRLVF